MADLIWVDYALLAIILVSTLVSFFRGFFKEALSLAGWALALWATWQFGVPVQGLLQPYVADPVLAGWLARGLVFVVTLIAAGLVTHLIVRLVAGTGLSGTDRSLGMVFGAGRGVLLVGLLLGVLQAFGFAQSAWWPESKLIPYAAPVTDFILHLAQDGIEYLDAVGVPETD